jgi:adenylate cyclase
MVEGTATRRLAAIVAADVVGYSRMLAENETATLDAMKAHRLELWMPKIDVYGGRVAGTAGDSILVEFQSAVAAVECAAAIQCGMAERNAELPEGRQIRLRVGVNIGEVVVDGEDIFGDGVNVAARLEALAEPGGICASDDVMRQIRGKLDLDFIDGGPKELKNIPVPVHVWHWSMEAPKPDNRGQHGISPELDDKPSIAVLPFACMSGDPEQEFFADGLVEDIITTLSKLAGLRVIARNSTFVYKGQAVDVRDAARQLGVRYVLQGSVRKSANRIRITAQLIDASSGSHVWAERYDRAIDDIFAVQDEITLVLATEMQVKLTEGEQARLRYTTTGNVEAWTHWVQGLFYYRQAVTKENMAGALSCWTKALALDPNSSSLNAMIGFIHYADARFGWWDDRETAHGKAQNYADRALELDPENSDANVTASLALLQRGRYVDAAAKAQRAVQLAPSSADAATFACFVLAFAGYPDEAVAHGEMSLTLSPNYPGFYLGHLGNAYRLAGRFDKAIAAFEAYHARSAGFGLSDLVITYQQIDQPERAKQAAEQLLSVRRDFTVAAWAKTQFRADGARLEADMAALLAAGLPMG